MIDYLTQILPRTKWFFIMLFPGRSRRSQSHQKASFQACVDDPNNQDFLKAVEDLLGEYSVKNGSLGLKYANPQPIRVVPPSTLRTTPEASQPFSARKSVDATTRSNRRPSVPVRSVSETSGTRPREQTPTPSPSTETAGVSKRARSNPSPQTLPHLTTSKAPNDDPLRTTPVESMNTPLRRPKPTFLNPGCF
jgi:hypothetical protein